MYDYIKAYRTCEDYFECITFNKYILDNIGCQGDIGERKAKSESAEVECMSRDCFHVRRSDARSPRLNTTTRLPTKSLLKGKYTPWIAYRGACTCICKWVGPVKRELFNGRGGQTTRFVLSHTVFFFNVFLQTMPVLIWSASGDHSCVHILHVLGHPAYFPICARNAPRTICLLSSDSCYQ